MNYRILLLFSLFLLLSLNVSAVSPTDLQFFSDGEPSGLYAGKNFDLIITFESPVLANDVVVDILVPGFSSINPSRCEDTVCYVENIFISNAGEYEISVKHQSNLRYFIINIDTGKPLVQGMRIFKRGESWLIGADIFDPLSDGSESEGSGITKIEIIQSGSVVDTTTIAPLSDYYFEKSSPFDVTGNTITFQMKVYDRAGNTALSNFNRQLDSIAPEIMNINEGSTIWYTDAQDRVIVNIIVNDDDRIDLDNSYVSIGTEKNNFDSCINVNSDYYCTARIPIPLSYIGSNHNVVVLVRDRFGNEAKRELTATIQVDSTRPELIRLWSEARSYDEPARAFLFQGEFFAEFENAPSGMDATSTVAKIIVPYTLEVSANRCIIIGDIARCYFSVPDLSQGSITAKVIRGKDNSGNDMVNSNDEVLLHIDSVVPAVRVGIGPSYGSLSTDAVVTLPEGSSANVRIISAIDTGSMINNIMIKKYSVTTNELVSEEEFETSGCSRTINEMYCDIPSFSIVEDTRLDISVLDGSNNNAFVSRIVRTGDSLVGSNNWRITSQKVSPQFYFSGVPSQFVLNLGMVSNDVFFGTTIGQARVSGCSASIGNVENMMVFAENSNIRLVGILSTSESQNGISEIECDIELFSQRDRLISSDSEVINVKFNITAYSTGVDPNDPTNRASSNTNFEFLSSPSALSIMGTAEEIVEIGETLCTAYTLLTSTSMGLDFLSAATSAGTGVGPVEPAAKAVDEANTKLEDNVEKVCGYVTCDTPGSKKILDIYNVFEGKLVGNLSELGILSLSHSTNRNVQDSFVQSVLSACVPGIVKNVRKMQQVECGYAVCLMDASDSNIPASMCDYARSTGQCEVFASELFVLVPYGVIVKDFTVNINSLLTRPITIAGGFIMDIITKNNPTARGILKFSKYVQTLAPMIGIDISTTPTPPAIDYCSMLEDRRNN